MAETKQGAFDIFYPHIEAPTWTDEEYGKTWKKRKLRLPLDGQKAELFRIPELEILAGCRWQGRRKLDGQNMRILWQGEQVLWNGKTNNATSTAVQTDYMNQTFPEEIFEEQFGRDKTVVLFGEYMGPKVQKNELALTSPELILFDVLINDIWQPADTVKSIAKYFKLRTCYDFGKINSSDHTLTDLILSVAEGRYVDWEGVVATPDVELRDKQGQRVIVKIKNRDYYREGRGPSD